MERLRSQEHKSIKCPVRVFFLIAVPYCRSGLRVQASGFRHQGSGINVKIDRRGLLYPSVRGAMGAMLSYLGSSSASHRSEKL